MQKEWEVPDGKREGKDRAASPGGEAAGESLGVEGLAVDAGAVRPQVRPNLQYIKQPGGVDEVDNALVAGIKIQTVF